LTTRGLYWIEEPVRHDDYAASAELAALLRTPERTGGVIGWQGAAALADAAKPR
jgi:mandelate racemase